MDYLTAKESRVEKAWNKRGLAGLRIELLRKVEERTNLNWSDSEFVKRVCVAVWSVLPVRNWDDGEQYIRETCGLAGVSVDDTSWKTIMLDARLVEEGLREDIGDE